MKDGTCPKCNSSSVFKQQNGVRPERQFWVYTGVNSGIPSSYQTTAETYLCIDCGYFENYIPVDKRLEQVQKVWTKVS